MSAIYLHPATHYLILAALVIAALGLWIAQIREETAEDERKWRQGWHDHSPF